MRTNAVILAAGHGTRMRSRLPKVLHPLMGRPMVFYSLEVARQATGSPPVMVVGHESEAVQKTLGDAARFVIQETQLGTGHALQQAEQLMSGQTDLVLVLTADMPLLSAKTLQELVRAQENHSGPLTMLTVEAQEARGFGRVIRRTDGSVAAVVEEAQATPEELAVSELNASVYCFDSEWVWEALKRIPLSAKGEYYLTDLIAIAVADGGAVQAMQVDEVSECIGINTRVHLAEAEAVLRRRINEAWMLSGVTFIDPMSTYIEPGVKIGQDSVIWPNTYMLGETTVGENCVLGPNAIIRDTQIGSDCKVFNSVLERAILEAHVDVGPFGHLRKGAHLAKGVHMGNFGEVKNSYLGPDTKMGHFSYIGDATIGADVNIGAGTVTCNFDGEHKHATEIGANVFVGSDTMLVAPVKLGDGARTGAGSVVTKNVPEDTLVVGMPARAIRKLEKREQT